MPIRPASLLAPLDPVAVGAEELVLASRIGLFDTMDDSFLRYVNAVM